MGDAEAAPVAGTILWAQASGYPFWPAQVMSADATAEYAKFLSLPGNRSADFAFLQFFGTGQANWHQLARTASWEDGLAKGYDKKKLKSVVTAIEQATAMLADPASHPSGHILEWWSDPGRNGCTSTAPKKHAERKAPPEAAAAAAKEEASPLPPAKAVPPPNYQTIRRNVWMCSAAPKQLSKHDIPVCSCRPPPESSGKEWLPAARGGCGEECLNRNTSIFCDQRLCPCGKACSNRPFHLLPAPKLKAVPTPGRGYGVVAAEAIPARTFVVEYVGEILGDTTCEKRLWKDKSQGQENFYMMEVSHNQVIDARYKGNMSRLINSACEPNCVTQRWTEAATGETRVGIFTLRDVAAGEELTYDYCFTHFDADNADAASFRCCCGSPRCRGSLDTNPLRAQHRGRRVAVMWDDGTFYKGTIIHFFGSTGKYKVIYDDGDTETVKLDGEKIKYEWLPEGDAPPPESVMGQFLVAEAADKARKLAEGSADAAAESAAAAAAAAAGADGGESSGAAIAAAAAAKKERGEGGAAGDAEGAEAEAAEAAEGGGGAGGKPAKRGAGKGRRGSSGGAGARKKAAGRRSSSGGKKGGAAAAAAAAAADGEEEEEEEAAEAAAEGATEAKAEHSAPEGPVAVEAAPAPAAEPATAAAAPAAAAGPGDAAAQAAETPAAAAAVVEAAAAEVAEPMAVDSVPEEPAPPPAAAPLSAAAATAAAHGVQSPALAATMVSAAAAACHDAAGDVEVVSRARDALLSAAAGTAADGEGEGEEGTAPLLALLTDASASASPEGFALAAAALAAGACAENTNALFAMTATAMGNAAMTCAMACALLTREKRTRAASALEEEAGDGAAGGPKRARAEVEGAAAAAAPPKEGEAAVALLAQAAPGGPPEDPQQQQQQQQQQQA